MRKSHHRKLKTAPMVDTDALCSTYVARCGPPAGLTTRSDLSVRLVGTETKHVLAEVTEVARPASRASVFSCRASKTRLRRSF